MNTHEYTKRITDQQVDDLMASAITGMAYWSDEADLVNDDMGTLYLSQGLTRGYTMRIHETEEDKWHELTLGKLLKGLSLTDNLDLENYDMYDAERVVQRALFGKEVYA